MTAATQDNRPVSPEGGHVHFSTDLLCVWVIDDMHGSSVVRGGDEKCHDGRSFPGSLLSTNLYFGHPWKAIKAPL